MGLGSGTSYKQFTNARANTKTPENLPLKFCVDTGSSLSLIDKGTLDRHFPGHTLHSMDHGKSVRIAGIGEGPETSKYVILPLVLTTDLGKEITITGEVHVIPKLSCHLLVGVNILCPNKISISWANKAQGKPDAIMVQDAKVPLNVIFETPTQAPR